MKNLLRLSFSAAIAILASGCLESPILKHATAGARNDQGQLDAACPLAFANAGLCAAPAWETIPAAGTRGVFILRFWSAKDGSEHGPYVAPASAVFIEPFMESMNHGTPVPVRFEPVLDAGGQAVPGVYRASDVALFMPGEWAIRVKLHENGQIRDQAKFSITI